MRQTATRVFNGATGSPLNDLIANAVRRDRQARRTKLLDSGAELVGQIIGTFLCGWMFMLAVGVIHHQWIPACPTVGYGPAVVILALIRTALAIPNRKS